MFSSDVLYFAFGSIIMGIILDSLIVEDVHGINHQYYISLIGWKLPNYLLSSLIYLTVQMTVNNACKKNVITNRKMTIINFRYIIVSDISDAITMFIWNMTCPLLFMILSSLGMGGKLICSYINASSIYEYRLVHIPTIGKRVRYCMKDPVFLILFGYPLTYIQFHEQLSWFTIHHISNLLIICYIQIVWSLPTM